MREYGPVAGGASADAVRAELALVAARFLLPGLDPDVDQAIGVACDLLVEGLGTPAAVEVAGLSYGTPLRDAGPLIREMLAEQGFAPAQPAGPRWVRGDDDGFFLVFRGEDGAAAAALRDAMGEEAFASWQRRVLLEHPRPLTDMERAVLHQAAAPLLADLAASGMSVPDIRDEAHEDREEAVCGWIQEPDGTGEGIWVRLDSSPAEQVRQLAGQLQDSWVADRLHDAARPPSWPACPLHPGSLHRLDPQVRDGRAVWVCLETGQVIWPIGELDIPGSGARRRRGHRRGR